MRAEHHTDLTGENGRCSPSGSFPMTSSARMIAGVASDAFNHHVAADSLATDDQVRQQAAAFQSRMSWRWPSMSFLSGPPVVAVLVVSQCKKLQYSLTSMKRAAGFGQTPRQQTAKPEAAVL